ncbi:MAG: ferrous iron transport protein B [Nitrospirae bacterium]|nr:ferrous iron transport protein B [Nitrospirota bacterium]MBF0533591.1 ferrous iron transport protein B [Nitrospirota bacterium]MBF0617992.1 ferrous iron transport protein B [Nitrospirota bacterium]
MTEVTNPKKYITVAVAGNPNAGKSTLINAICGSRLHVGNWSGVTVEKKEAVFVHGDIEIKLVDLPGVYSLSPFSQDEVIARTFLLNDKPDCIINVVDATNLERNLSLTIQLMELEIPIIMALNIYDEAEKKGYKIDYRKMAEMLGIFVVPTVARKKQGVSELLDAVVNISLSGNRGARKPKQLVYDEDVESAMQVVKEEIQRRYPEAQNKYPLKWLSYMVLEGDPVMTREFEAVAGPDIISRATEHIREAHDSDIRSVIADARYAISAGLAHEVLSRPLVPKIEFTEKIDKLLLNKYLGIPTFLVFIWFIFKLTFDISAPFSNWISGAFSGPVTTWLRALLVLVEAPQWMVSLLTEGVIAGVGLVLTFFPMIFTMMFFITFLEGSGYMARAAFVMDGLMHTVGLHGKSFIPMLLGFGCNVPAIYATRTLETGADKILTALLIPLMSCSARLPVYILFVSVFFGAHSGTVLWSLYVLGIVLAFLVGIILRKSVFKGEVSMFIMELPPYRIPSFNNLMVHSWEKGKHFVAKAGTYIFAMSILIWFLFNLPWGVENKRDSYLGQAGKALSPVFKPLGFGNWEAVSSLITGVVAKEIVVSTMGEIYAGTKKGEANKTLSVADDLRELIISFIKACRDSVRNVFSSLMISSIGGGGPKETPSPLISAIHGAFSPLSAYAFMVFVLIYMPCMVTAAAFKHEFGSWKWFGVAVSYELSLAWAAAFVIYQVGALLKLGV